ncbi:hypothetical protein AB0N81_22805 [Streptomyces sp. NPDC093510]|uniref:hypothetical protein n=1 Tax=Streptomyces sp. NPDC093510 TaxID=3155199 RepID=UPI0034161771
MLGAFAAIGGIAFSGIATYYSARVAEDQLAQSRDEAETESRIQASKVTFHGGIGNSGSSMRYNIINRSADPVSDVRATLGMPIEEVRDDGDRSAFDRNMRLEIGSIPPCSRVVISASLLKGAQVAARIPERRQSDGALRVKVMTKSQISIVRLNFADTSGRQWTRTWKQLRRGHAEVGFKVSDLDSQRSWLLHSVWLKSQPTVKPVEPCGGA